MTTNTQTITTFEGPDGIVELQHNENLGIHVRLAGRLVGWSFKDVENAYYLFNKLCGSIVIKERVA